MSTLATCIQHWFGDSNQAHQIRKRNAMHPDWKLSVFSDYMILYIEILRNPHTKKSINANKWDQQVCRTQDQYKIIVFLYTCNKQSKDKIKKIISERI